MYPEPPMELLGLVSVACIVLCREDSENIYDEPLVFHFVNKAFFILIFLVSLFRDFRSHKKYLHSSAIKTASLTSWSLSEWVEISLRSVIYNFSLDLNSEDNQIVHLC